ncbi:hypothetical protein OnM2_096024 [Erysiphe neolycopersici]|uniref:Uncharacterized protein n=1 Tax=Erysiphe neolycopersici TaxID=212602 RepID=A0A420HAV4_9PEZI|nr:hypothetical protein OnM2_096024 [Erysiphe neolycopersici]
MINENFPFLDLPPEIRTQIYRLLLVQKPQNLVVISPRLIDSSPPFYASSYLSTTAATYPFNLLLSCSLIYEEIRPLYFNVNTFLIILGRHNNTLSYLLHETRFRSSLRLIRRLRLSIVRWGCRNFFEITFAPFLQDCILNGNLRHLELFVRESWVSSVKKQHGGNDNDGRDRQNWRALKTLLKDPYLENISIWALPGNFYENLEDAVQSYKTIDVAWLLND